MRTYGRTQTKVGNTYVYGPWTEIDTDANGFNDAVWFTTLAQTLKLGRGESPFFASYGIPAQQSVIQQLLPDFFVAQTQQQFSIYFAALQVARVPGTLVPTYNIKATFNNGASISQTIPVQ